MPWTESTRRRNHEWCNSRSATPPSMPNSSSVNVSPGVHQSPTGCQLAETLCPVNRFVSTAACREAQVRSIIASNNLFFIINNFLRINKFHNLSSYLGLRNNPSSYPLYEDKIAIKKTESHTLHILNSMHVCYKQCVRGGASVCPHRARTASTLSAMVCGSMAARHAWSPRAHGLLPKMLHGRHGSSACTVSPGLWFHPRNPA